MTSSLAHVAFTTSTYGINTGGTVYRMDDVPISLRSAYDSPFPSDEKILTAIKNRVIELTHAKRGASDTREKRKVA
jgi:formylmethanofuran dehydrogenase subunit B